MTEKYPHLKFDIFGYGVTTMQREHPSKMKSHFLITRHGYRDSIGNEVNQEIRCPGQLTKVKCIFRVEKELTKEQDKKGFISNFTCTAVRDFNINEYAEIRFDEQKGQTVLHFFYMPPSTTIVLKVKMHKKQAEVINSLDNVFKNMLSTNSDFVKHVQNLSAADINYLLYQ